MRCKKLKKGVEISETVITKALDGLEIKPALEVARCRKGNLIEPFVGFAPTRFRNLYAIYEAIPNMELRLLGYVTLPATFERRYRKQYGYRLKSGGSVSVTDAALLVDPVKMSFVPCVREYSKIAHKDLLFEDLLIDPQRELYIAAAWLHDEYTHEIVKVIAGGVYGGKVYKVYANMPRFAIGDLLFQIDVRKGLVEMDIDTEDLEWEVEV